MRQKDRHRFGLLLYVVLMPVHVVRRTFGVTKAPGNRCRQKHAPARHTPSPHPRHFPGLPLNYLELRRRFGAALHKA